jgi:hypothetical protein
VARLRLKAIGHYGVFLEHTIGGRVQSTDYAVLTRPALRYMDVDPHRLGLLPHSERYEHFGEVECFIGDLARASSAAG